VVTLSKISQLLSRTMASMQDTICHLFRGRKFQKLVLIL
jgi:hypothetical protein